MVPVSSKDEVETLTWSVTFGYFLSGFILLQKCGSPCTTLPIIGNADHTPLALSISNDAFIAWLYDVKQFTIQTHNLLMVVLLLNDTPQATITQ